MIKTIIFDFDGVIINEYQTHYELNKKKITDLTEEEFLKFFESDINTERERLKSRDTGFDTKYHFNKYKETVIIEDDIKEILRRLSKKYIIGIISSSKETSILPCIKNNHLEDIFAFAYGYETHKLKAEKFKMVFEKYNISKGECVFITDTLGDILEANKISLKTIAFDGGYHSKDILIKGNPFKIISDLSELEGMVKDI